MKYCSLLLFRPLLLILTELAGRLVVTELFDCCSPQLFYCCSDCWLPEQYCNKHITQYVGLQPASQQSFLEFAEIKWRFIAMMMIQLCCFGVWRFIGFVRKSIFFVLFCQNISSDLIKTDEAYFGGKLFSLDSFNQMINQNKMDI